MLSIINLPPKLNISDRERGLPRQPIIVRRAFLVSALPFTDFLSLFITPRTRGDMLLTAYQYTDNEELGTPPVSPQDYAKRLEIAQRYQYKKLSPQECVKYLPLKHFVWSNDLADAINQFIMIHHDHEVAGKEIQWDTELDETEDLINKVEAPSASPKPRKKKNKKSTRDECWRKERDKLKKANPRLSASAIATQIAKSPELNPEDRSSETIRRILSSK